MLAVSGTPSAEVRPVLVRLGRGTAGQAAMTSKSTYASGITASVVQKSRAEIEHILQRFGATHFLSGSSPTDAVVSFQIGGRAIKITLHMPDPNSDEFNYQKSLAIRERWRALALVIKAKLAAIEAGITTVEEEFLAFTMLPDKRTVGQWLLPQMQVLLTSGRMPPLLSAG